MITSSRWTTLLQPIEAMPTVNTRSRGRRTPQDTNSGSRTLASAKGGKTPPKRRTANKALTLAASAELSLDDIGRPTGLTSPPAAGSPLLQGAPTRPAVPNPLAEVNARDTGADAPVVEPAVDLAAEDQNAAVDPSLDPEADADTRTSQGSQRGGPASDGAEVRRLRAELDELRQTMANTQTAPPGRPERSTRVSDDSDTSSDEAAEGPTAGTEAGQAEPPSSLSAEAFAKVRQVLALLDEESRGSLPRGTFEALLQRAPMGGPLRGRRGPQNDTMPGPEGRHTVGQHQTSLAFSGPGSMPAVVPGCVDHGAGSAYTTGPEKTELPDPPSPQPPANSFSNRQAGYSPQGVADLGFDSPPVTRTPLPPKKEAIAEEVGRELGSPASVAIRVFELQTQPVYQSLNLSRNECRKLASLEFSPQGFSLETLNRPSGWRSGSQDEDERIQVRLNDDGTTGYSTVTPKKKAITTAMTFFQVMFQLALALEVHGKWLARRVHAFTAGLRALPVLAMAGQSEMDRLAPSLATLVNEQLYRLSSTAYTFVEQRLRGMPTYGLRVWDPQVFDVHSMFNAGLVQRHLVHATMHRFLGAMDGPSERTLGEKSRRAQHEVVHSLKDADGVPICVNFHRGKCTGSVCPHGRSHAELSKSQAEQYELSFVRRRGGKSRSHGAKGSGHDE